MLTRRSLSMAFVLPVALCAVPAFAQDEESGAQVETSGEASAEVEAGATVEVGGGAEAVAATGEGSMAPEADLMMGPGVYTKDTWPQELTRRPITLAKGMMELKGDILVNMTKDAVGKPFSLSPDIFYGVSDKLSVGLTHDTGLCLAGEDNNCPKVYNDVGVEAILAFMTGNLNLGAHGGLSIDNFDPMFLSLEVGVLGKLMSGKLAVTFDPSVSIGLTERDAGNKELLVVPVQVAFQATPQLAPYLVTGLAGMLDGFGDGFVVPVGVGALFALSNKLDVGGQFLFTNLAGKDGSADGRQLDVFVNFRM